MKKILLHICCGPCAIIPARWLLSEGFLIEGWFMNPNIQPLAEYLRRREAAVQCAEKLGFSLTCEDAAWDMTDWLARQLSQANNPARCHWCCAMRLENCARNAVRLGIPYFSTSLLYSPYQPHEFIASTGHKLAAEYGLKFVYQDFRAHYKEGAELSRQWELYRQPYCGCVFSETERYAKKLARLIKTNKKNS